MSKFCNVSVKERETFSSTDIICFESVNDYRRRRRRRHCFHSIK